MNRKTKLAGLLFGLTQLLAVETAQANVTFDSTPAFPATSLAFVADGFSFSTGLLHTVSNVSGFGASNGTNYLAYYALNGNQETFWRADSSLFNLSSIDLGGSVNFGGSSQTLTVTGHQSNGNSVTVQLSVAPTSFTTFSLNGFTDLQWVRLGSLSRGYVAVDNIIATPVPEPETYALFLAGLGLMAVIARRRRDS